MPWTCSLQHGEKGEKHRWGVKRERERKPRKKKNNFEEEEEEEIG